MSKVNNSILQIIQRNGAENKHLGTGFVINKNGYFVTVRHIIPKIEDISDIYARLNNQEYKVMKIESNEIEYSNNEVDLLMFVLKTSSELPHIPISYVYEGIMHGQVEVIGFPNEVSEIKQGTFAIHGIKEELIELTTVSEKVPEGFSGAPVFLLRDNQPSKLLGVFAHSLESYQAIHFAYGINQLVSIGYKFEANLEHIKEQCEKVDVEANKDAKITLEQVLFRLHDCLEHRLIEMEDDLKIRIRQSDNSNICSEVLRVKLDSILFEMGMVLEPLYGDIAMNIKLIAKDKDGVRILKAFSRKESKRELDASVRRSRAEEFLVNKITNANELIAFEQDTEMRGRKVNSAYNEVCNRASEYFLCNNLEYASANGLYYSSSKDYAKCYNSLVVFPIVNRLASDNLKIKGLFIIDSMDTGVFDRKNIRSIGGYLTHRLNRLLSSEYFRSLFNTV